MKIEKKIIRNVPKGHKQISEKITDQRQIKLKSPHEMR